MKNSLFLFSVLSILQACSTLHPCQEGGDTQFGPATAGNRQCHQKKNREGTFVNHGPYIQWHPNGKAAIEGSFKFGLKEGLWIFHDDVGHKIKEAFFIDGVETPRDSAPILVPAEAKEKAKEKKDG